MRIGVVSSREREVHNSSIWTLHKVVICEGIMSLAVLRSHDDAYVLYHSIMLDDPLVTKIGDAFRKFLLWPTEYLCQSPEA